MPEGTNNTPISDGKGDGTAAGRAGRRFRKRPVEVEAIQFTGNSALSDLFDFIQCEWQCDERGLHITTLEGVMTAKVGDWIIRGVAGEYYPCKPRIFAETYEQVSA